MRLRKLLLCCAMAVGLAACGGGDDAPSNQTDVNAQTVGSGTFKANTYLFSTQDAQGSTLTDTLFVVRKPQNRTFAVGDVLVVDDHGGRLIRITAVQDNTDSIAYSYTPASLAQAFDTLDVNLQGELTQADLGTSFETGDPEIELAWATTANGQRV